MVRRGGALVVFGLSAIARRGVGAAGTLASLASLALFGVLPGKRRSVFALDRTFHRDPARVRVGRPGGRPAPDIHTFSAPLARRRCRFDDRTPAGVEDALAGGAAGGSELSVSIENSIEVVAQINPNAP